VHEHKEHIASPRTAIKISVDNFARKRYNTENRPAQQDGELAARGSYFPR